MKLFPQPYTYPHPYPYSLEEVTKLSSRFSNFINKSPAIPVKLYFCESENLKTSKNVYTRTYTSHTVHCIIFHIPHLRYIYDIFLTVAILTSTHHMILFCNMENYQLNFPCSSFPVSHLWPRLKIVLTNLI